MDSTWLWLLLLLSHRPSGSANGGPCSVVQRCSHRSCRVWIVSLNHPERHPAPFPFSFPTRTEAMDFLSPRVLGLFLTVGQIRFFRLCGGFLLSLVLSKAGVKSRRVDCLALMTLQVLNTQQEDMLMCRARLSNSSEHVEQC